MEELEIVVEKKAQQIVSSSSIPTIRKAHFLNPIDDDSVDLQIPRKPTSLSCRFTPETCPLNVSFIGWRHPTEKWKSWVHHMRKRYELVWKKVGIYDAIISTTCNINRDDVLLIGLAEKWCSDTDTFVFPWAETTVTLEDVMILGGFSVLGCPAFSVYLESDELLVIEKKMKDARTKLGRTPANKATQAGWMSMFMFSGSEIEHEAFLTFWLARFVLHDSEQILKASLFPVAIRLARGEVVALAPAVLASVYRDLSLLKAAILSVNEFEISETYSDVLAVTVWSPFHLVQLWAWERFPAFQPKSKFVKSGEPRYALWNNVRGKRVRDVRLALDSAAETFHWRPYAPGLHGVDLYEFYKEKEEWVDLESNQEMFAFTLCLRVSELVGLGCVEQYLPHRVARQFGLDQGIPCDIAKSNEFIELSWINYIRPFGHAKLFVPSKCFEPGVSVKYLNWWKQSEDMNMFEDAVNDVVIVRKKRSSRPRVKWASHAMIEKKMKNSPKFLSSPPLNYCQTGTIKNSCEDVKPTIEELMRSCEIKKTVKEEPCGDFTCLAGQTQHLSYAKAKMNSAEKPAERTVMCRPFKEERVDIEDGILGLTIPILELEARIAMLERTVAEMKAERFCSRVGRNCT